MRRLLVVVTVLNGLAVLAVGTVIVLLITSPGIFSFAKRDAVAKTEQRQDELAVDLETRLTDLHQRTTTDVTALKEYARTTWALCNLVRDWSTFDPSQYEVSPLARAMAKVCDQIGVPSGDDFPVSIRP